MAIFPDLKQESIVQVGDKTRLDASGSFCSPIHVLNKVEIDPDGSGFIDCTQSKYLDWAYITAGTKNIQVRVEVSGGGGGIVTNPYTITVLSAADDNLFSNDEDLMNHEPDILKWVREGRNSYKDMHRRAQEIILDTLHRLGYTNKDNERFVPADVVDILEVKEWSTFLTLAIIFKGLSNAVDDVFSIKAKNYYDKAAKSMDSAKLRLDINGDGELSDSEFQDMTTIKVERR